MLQGMTAHYLSHSTFPLKAGRYGAGSRRGRRRGPAADADGRAAGRARDYHGLNAGQGGTLARGRRRDVILYTEQDFEAEVKRLTGGKGVDVVYDSVGKTTFEGSLNCLRPRGLLALFGASSGPVPPFDLIQLSSKGSLFVTRPTLWHYMATRAELEWRSGRCAGLGRQGRTQAAHRAYLSAGRSGAGADGSGSAQDDGEDFAGAVKDRGQGSGS
jgi:NADPH2:quinone reductase